MVEATGIGSGSEEEVMSPTSLSSCWEPGEALHQVRGREAWVGQFSWGLGPPTGG